MKLSTGLGAADGRGYLVRDRDLIATRSRYPVAGTAGYWETCGLGVEQWNVSVDCDKQSLGMQDNLRIKR